MIFNRICISLSAAFPVTIGLLFLMQLLIHTGRPPLTPTITPLIDLVTVREDSEIKEHIDPPTPPQPIEPQPSRPNLDNDPDPTTVQITKISPPIEEPTLTIGVAMTEGDLYPLSRVRPVYPARATQRGLEGYVILEFTVTKSGSVRDVIVIESTSSVFERSAINAVEKFKYRPRVVSGDPVDVTGVQIKLSFALED